LECVIQETLKRNVRVERRFRFCPANPQSAIRNPQSAIGGSMIQGIHGMFYSEKAVELRAFLRDKLRLPFTDVGGGWLIFDFKEGDLGCHPTDHPGSPPSGTHNISFFCDDIKKTVAELRGRGVEFSGEISDQGFGFVITLKMPGGVEATLYEPRYSKKKAKPAKKKPSRAKTQRRKGR
jgi:hypothetical protein